MKLTIKLNMDNDAFSDEYGGACGVEAARILRELAERIDGHPHFSDGHSQCLRDVNGNEVGHATVKKGSHKL